MYSIHLSKPIEGLADGQGGFKKGEVLEIAEPSMMNYNHIATLKGFVGKAMLTMSTMNQDDLPSSNEAVTDENTPDKMDGNTARMMLQMADVYADASQEFMKFLIKNSTIDEIKCTDLIIKKMDVKDFEKAMGEYFANFLFEM